ncbi:hypothetical protein V3C99_006919 [Haemonchus contortus]
MSTPYISPAFQIFYIVIPTIGIIGNSLIIYVTIISKSLRSSCNIIIGLITFGDILQLLGQYVMIVSYNVIPGHMMREDICVYWQFVPVFGTLFSSVLLLCIAIDRLMSVQRFYALITRDHEKAYIVMQVGVALTFTLPILGWIFVERSNKMEVLCIITAVMMGDIYTVVIRSIMVINVLIIACYVLFFCFIRRAHISNDSMKHLYRSLIVISFTAVFGWFSTTIIGTVVQVLKLDIPYADAMLLAGLFVNTACAINFFVYYGVSHEYRQVFHEHLFCKCFGANHTLRVSPTPAASHEHHNGPSTKTTTADAKS